jgi:hypothetical protein
MAYALTILCNGMRPDGAYLLTEVANAESESEGAEVRFWLTHS